MRDLSLHILDLIENSLRAGATAVALTVTEEPEKDRLTVTVEDNGPGLSVKPETATDPFYTTKEGKRTGLGLSLLKATAEEAGGSVRLSRSPMGGLLVEAVMRLDHVDRKPLGDVAATVASVVCTNPGLDLRCRFVRGDREYALRVPDVAKQLHLNECCGLGLARCVSERIRTGWAATGITA